MCGLGAAAAFGFADYLAVRGRQTRLVRRAGVSYRLGAFFNGNQASNLSESSRWDGKGDDGEVASRKREFNGQSKTSRGRRGWRNGNNRPGKIPGRRERAGMPRLGQCVCTVQISRSGSTPVGD